MDNHRSTDPAVAEFMKLVGEKPLLNKAEEERLGVQMDQGRHAQWLLSRNRTERGSGAALRVLRETAAMRTVATAAASLAHLNPNPTLHDLAYHPGFRRIVDRKIDDSHLTTIARVLTKEQLERLVNAVFQQDDSSMPDLACPRQCVAALIARLSRNTLCLTPSMLIATHDVRLNDTHQAFRNRYRRSFLTTINHKIEQELDQCVESGLEAQDRMSEANMRLVVHIARKFINNNTDLVDLSQEGAVGLIDAAKRFDHRRGYKFSTYATNWIQHRISKALGTMDRTIRIPHQKHKLAMDLYYARERLLQQMSMEPTSSHIAQEMGITVELVEEIQRIDRQPESLDAIIWDDANTTQIDRVSLDAPGTDELAMERLLKPDIHEALEVLDEKERQVLIMRYGLLDDSPKTVTDISIAIHTSKERVREIEQTALANLRSHPEVIAKLSAYL